MATKKENIVKPETVESTDGRKYYCKSCGYELEILKEKGPKGGRRYWCDSCKAEKKKGMAAPPSDEEMREASQIKTEGDVMITDEGEVLIQFDLTFPVELVDMYSTAMAAGLEHCSFNEFVVRYATIGFVSVQGCELSLVQRQGEDSSGRLDVLQSEVEELKNALISGGLVFRERDFTPSGEEDDAEIPDENLN